MEIVSFKRINFNIFISFPQEETFLFPSWKWKTKIHFSHNFLSGFVSILLHIKLGKRSIAHVLPKKWRNTIAANANDDITSIFESILKSYISKAFFCFVGSFLTETATTIVVVIINNCQSCIDSQKNWSFFFLFCPRCVLN